MHLEIGNNTASQPLTVVVFGSNFCLTGRHILSESGSVKSSWVISQDHCVRDVYDPLLMKGGYQWKKFFHVARWT